MSTTIESLELEIRSNSANAVSGIDALTQSLTKLKTATTGLSGLKSVATQMKNIGDASRSIDPGSVNTVTGLAKAIQLLNGVKISTSIANQITAISTSLQSANFSGGEAKMRELVSALAPLQELSRSNLSSFVTPLKNLPKVFAELNKIDMGAFAAKMRELATSLKPVGDEMQKIANGFSAFPARIQRLLASTNQMSVANKKAAFSYTELYHKLRLVKGLIMTVGGTIYSLIQKSSDYVENVNLFTVAMGDYAGEAQEYAETVGEAMGIDPGEWMRNQGVFMTLATGFGVAGDRAAIMSQNLTQLGYDLSSFFNISYEDAMQKLQSGLSGELEPLRRIGYDLSQAKLEATALALGIDKTVSSMTQAEKAQLRYYAIMTQVTTAQGDMARTLNAPANQLKVLKAQFNMAAREIGNIFIPALNAILPYAIAVTKVIRLLASAIASIVGFEMPEVDYSGVNSMSGAATDTGDALDDAADSAKKLKSYMLGFDELNVINPDSGDSIEETSDMFDFELPTYDFLEGLADSRVAEIVEDMKEWLGISEDIHSWTDLINTKFGEILVTVGAIGAGIAAWKVGAGVYGAITSIGAALSSMSPVVSAIAAAVGAVTGVVWLIVAAILAVVAGLTAVYMTNEQVRSGVVNALANIGKSLKPLVAFIIGTVVPGLKKAWNELIVILTPFGQWLKMVFTSVWQDMIIPVLNYLSTTVIPTLTTYLKNMWNNVLVPLGTFIGSVLTPVIRILSEVLTWLWQYIIVPLIDLVGGVFAAAWEALMKIINERVIPEIQKVITVMQFLWNKVLSPIVNFLWDVLSPAFKEVFKGIGNIITSIKKVFVGLINFVTGVFTRDWKQAWQGVKEIFKGIWDGLATLVKTPLNVALAKLEAFVNKIIDAWNWLKQQINTLSIDLPDWLGGKSFGFNLAMSSHVTIPRFAEGGFPAQGQMFVAREAGAEMVGSIGRRTAVANNDQIVAGIAGGVAEANEEQNTLLREQNTLLRAILEKESGTYIDGKHLAQSVEKYQRERGRVLITGGVV